jgi:tRNA(adenine34) deaminase
MLKPNDEFYMAEALKEAQKAFDKGEVPVGVVIVHKGRIIARAHNQVELLKDATAHAEILAMTQASSVLDNWRLTDTTIYVTKEPCPMCAGAMVNSRIKKLVFGVSDSEMGAAGSVMNIVTDERLRTQLEVESGVCEEPCRLILQEFFKKQRARGKAGEN